MLSPFDQRVMRHAWFSPTVPDVCAEDEAEDPDDVEEIDEPIEPVEQVDEFDEDDFDDDFDDDFEEELDDEDELTGGGDKEEDEDFEAG